MVRNINSSLQISAMKNFPKKLCSKTNCLRISVPENLDLALEGLIRKVLKEQPKVDDIYSFAADYFETLLKIRDQAGTKYMAGQVCPFHNDEDAHEMIKLANNFPKPQVEKTIVSRKPTPKKNEKLSAKIETKKITEEKKKSSKDTKDSKDTKNVAKAKVKDKTSSTEKKAVKPNITLNAVRKVKSDTEMLLKEKGISKSFDAKGLKIKEQNAELPSEEIGSEIETGKDLLKVSVEENPTEEEIEFLKSDPIKELVEKELMNKEGDIKAEKVEKESISENLGEKEEKTKTTEREKLEKEEDAESEIKLTSIEEVSGNGEELCAVVDTLAIQSQINQNLMEKDINKKDQEKELEDSKEKDIIETEKREKNSKEIEKKERKIEDLEENKTLKAHSIEVKSYDGLGNDEQKEIEKKARENENQEEVLGSNNNLAQSSKLIDLEQKDLILEKDILQRALEIDSSSVSEQISLKNLPNQEKENLKEETEISPERVIEKSDKENRISEEKDGNDLTPALKENENLNNRHPLTKRKTMLEVKGIESNEDLKNEKLTDVAEETAETSIEPSEIKQNEKIEITTEAKDDDREEKVEGNNLEETETVEDVSIKKNELIEQNISLAEVESEQKEKNIEKEESSEKSSIEREKNINIEKENILEDVMMSENGKNLIKEASVQKIEDKNILEDTTEEKAKHTERVSVTVDDKIKQGDKLEEIKAEEVQPEEVQPSEMKLTESEIRKKEKSDKKTASVEKNSSNEEVEVKTEDSKKISENQNTNIVEVKEMANNEKEKLLNEDLAKDKNVSDVDGEVLETHKNSKQENDESEQCLEQKQENEVKPLTDVEFTDLIKTEENPTIDLEAKVDDKEVVKDKKEKQIEEEPNGNVIENELNSDNKEKELKENSNENTAIVKRDWIEEGEEIPKNKVDVTDEEEKEVKIPEETAAMSSVSVTKETKMEKVLENSIEDATFIKESIVTENAETKIEEKEDDIKNLESKNQEKKLSEIEENKEKVEEDIKVEDIKISETQNVGTGEEEVKTEEETKTEPTEAVKGKENVVVEEELCSVVDKFNVVKVNKAKDLVPEKQIKTITTHLYDLLQVPQVVTKEYRVHHTTDEPPLESEIPSPPSLTPIQEAENKKEPQTEPIVPPFETDFRQKEADDLSDIMTPSSNYSLNVSELSWITVSEMFLENEKQYSSRGQGDLMPEIEGDPKEVVDVFHKTVLPTTSEAVPDPPRELEETSEEVEIMEEKKEHKPEPSSSEDSTELNTDSKNGNSIDSDTPIISVEVKTVIETQILDEEEDVGDIKEKEHVQLTEDLPNVEITIETAIDVLEESNSGDRNVAEAATVVQEEFRKFEAKEPAEKNSETYTQELVGDQKASAEESKDPSQESSFQLDPLISSSGDTDSTGSSVVTEIKRCDSGKKVYRRSSTQNILTTQSLDSNKKHQLLKTRSLSTFRQGVTDFEVWNTIEKELERAATTIQAKFRGYNTRKKLRREDAVQITTEESSVSTTPVELEEPKEEGQLSTGEFHDTIVLSVHPR